MVSLYEELAERSFLDEAEWVVSDVDRVLGRPRGIRIGEAPERDGQYFHYLTKWMHALCRMAFVTNGRQYADWAGELARTASAQTSLKYASSTIVSTFSS